METDKSGPRKGTLLPHERLDAYRDAVRFLAETHRLAARLGGRSEVADQLRRAALSIVLNLAEGGGEYRPREKIRFFRIAKRSAAESVAALEVVAVLRLPGAATAPELQENARRLSAMLTGLITATDARLQPP